ncbi:MAG: sigma-70 family RNA polymerase sigma factor, partial [Candidatus Caldarchaeum sp.]
FGFARKMRPSLEDAEDVAQEVFVKAFQNIRRFDHQASLTTWLFRITINLCIDRLRKQKKMLEPCRLDNPATIPSKEPIDRRYNPEDYVFANEMRTALAQALEQLSPKLKTVLLLHDGEGMNHQQISEVLNIPIGTVKSRLFLARTKLQEALKPFL